MKIFINCFCNNLRQAIISSKFLCAVLLTFFLYFLGGYNDIIRYWDVPNIDVLSIYDFLHNVGSYESMLVLCAVIPYGANFYSEWKSHFIRFSIPRSGYKCYTISKVLTCAVSGGLAISLGILFFILILSIHYPLVDMSSGAYSSYIESYNYGESAGNLNFPFLSIALNNRNYMLFFMGSIYLVFLFGAFWSVVGFCVSVFIPNIFVITFSPFIILFLEGLFLAYAPVWLRTSTLSKGFWCISESLVVNFIYASLFFILLIFVLATICHFVIKRRMQDVFH